MDSIHSKVCIMFLDPPNFSGGKSERGFCWLIMSFLWHTSMFLSLFLFCKRLTLLPKTGAISGTRPISTHLNEMSSRAISLSYDFPLAAVNRMATSPLYSYNRTIIIFSKIQLVVYYQCCILIGWATHRLYAIVH